MSSVRITTCRPAVSRLLRPKATLRCPQPSHPPLLQVRHKSGPYGYTQAKALVFSKYGEPNDVLYVHKHSISPSLPNKSVLVRTLAAPINPADVNTIQGTYGAKPSFSSLIGTSEPSAVGGNEGCFEVVSVGSGVTGLKKGDWVLPAKTGFGSWRTHALVEDADKALLKVSDKGGLTPLQVATVSVNPCSAYRMLKDFVDLIDLSVKSYASGRSTGGAWFIQNGANSGVGRAAIQLGKLWGLRSINVVRSREDKEAERKLKEELKGLGATVVVTEEEFMDRSFTARVKEEFTDGGKDPIMLGLNCVGGKNAGQIARCLGEGGTMVTYGAMSKQPVMLPTGLLIFKDLRFHGFWLSRWANRDTEGKKKTIEEILSLMKEKKFADVPMQEIKWDWETKEEVLKEAVQGTLQGFRSGKGVFVFGEDT
ncbi:mitochondrial 2-enoyl thioester reductase [Coniochaeta pulveracea]|uniref:enoyl-[acyl-carrier-protein] reductase n=1 Tax=Coniochaeta pulveracea TaxID=177199 RepID=A0A420XZ30_9PEZI|nr:mitochondrial 2-enoyl thioester reductase [Coniochaeta pulveracea]